MRPWSRRSARCSESDFLGEGHRKVRARLRPKGIGVGKNRVLRLMRENGLLAPVRRGHPRGDRSHSGRITTDAPNELWGTDVGHRCGAPMWGTDVGHRCGAPMWGTDVGHRCGAPMWGTDVGHRCGAPMWGTDVGHRCGAPMWGTDATRFYTKADGWCWFFMAVDHVSATSWDGMWPRRETAGRPSSRSARACGPHWGATRPGSRSDSGYAMTGVRSTRPTSSRASSDGSGSGRPLPMWGSRSATVWRSASSARSRRSASTSTIREPRGSQTRDRPVRRVLQPRMALRAARYRTPAQAREELTRKAA